MLLLLADFVVFDFIEGSVIAILYSRLPDLPYCREIPYFTPSFTSWKELAARETKYPVRPN